MRAIEHVRALRIIVCDQRRPVTAVLFAIIDGFTRLHGLAWRSNIPVSEAGSPVLL